jgi:hypothetical protein
MIPGALVEPRIESGKEKDYLKVSAKSFRSFLLLDFVSSEVTSKSGK